MQETLNDHQRKTHEHRPVKYVVWWIFWHRLHFQSTFYTLLYLQTRWSRPRARPAPMTGHAMAPCASAAELAIECMYVPIKQHHKNIEISKRWNHRKMVRLLQRNKRC